MSHGEYQAARDCAVLPAENGYVLFQGTTGRTFRVRAAIGRWLASGAVDPEEQVPVEEQLELYRIGLLTHRQRRHMLSVRHLVPNGAAGRIALSCLVLGGVLIWYSAGGYATQVYKEAVPVLLRNRFVWLLMPGTALTSSLIHEWGHVIALQALGGRAGRVLLRFGWPWAWTEVGPFQSTLSPGRSILLLSGGIVLELVALGSGLIGLVRNPGNPAWGALVITVSINLAFNMFPTPWSDGGRILAIALRAVRSLSQRRRRDDRSTGLP